MPFAREQAILKKILPSAVFKYLYQFACLVYGIYRKVVDRFYYAFFYVYYYLTRNNSGFRRLKTVLTVLPYTMLGRHKLMVTYDAVNKIESNGIGGCFVECGVARGGSSALMAMVADYYGTSRKTWLFDSFEGLPPSTNEDTPQSVGKHIDKHDDVLTEGYCLGTFDEVSHLLFNKLNLNPRYVFMVKGWFNETLPEYKMKVGSIAVLRLDADWYESTKCCLENLYDNVICGGYIIIDDYEIAGCRLAVDRFLSSQNVKVNMVVGQVGGSYFLKP